MLLIINFSHKRKLPLCQEKNPTERRTRLINHFYALKTADFTFLWHYLKSIISSGKNQRQARLSTQRDPFSEGRWRLVRIRATTAPGLASQALLTRTGRWGRWCAQGIPGRQCKVFPERGAELLLCTSRKHAGREEKGSSLRLPLRTALGPRHVIPRRVCACRVMPDRIGLRIGVPSSEDKPR